MSGSLPLRARSPRRLPDGRRLGRPRRPTCITADPAAPQRLQADARTTGRRRGAVGTTSRSWPPTSTSPSSSPGSTTTSTCAGSSATSRSPGRAAITPVVVLNKSDLADDVDGRLVAVDAIAPGVGRRRRLAPWTGAGLDELGRTSAPARPAAILGSSGVGKSTLVNALLGEDRQATAEVRDSDSRGRHTTTHRELFELPGGALLVDTPGIRALEVLGADEGVEAAFDDVADLAASCRFSDCRHEGEPGCAIRAALADGTPDRGTPGEPPEAGARDWPVHARESEPARPGRAPTHLEDHPQVGRRHMQRKYGGRMR